MKNPKTIVLLLLILISSCSNFDDTVSDPTLSKSLQSFKTRFSSEFKQLDLTKSQFFSQKNSRMIDSNEDSYDFLTTPVINRDKVIGRYVEYKNRAIYIDFSDYTERVIVTSLEDTSIQIEAKAIFNPITQQFTYDFDSPLIVTRTSVKAWWVQDGPGGCEDPFGFTACNVGCGISALAIALSDGPLPFADALAATYYISCVTTCGLSFCEKQ